ncbi:hypothetical protein ACFOWB_09770 [Chenggangzhangella methanolivorans]|uniref:hypothetical protein n=1 Tax=Chenggangzhangella methanolivorans TaxID=1437009 RepID=UPI003623088B
MTDEATSATPMPSSSVDADKERVLPTPQPSDSPSFSPNARDLVEALSRWIVLGRTRTAQVDDTTGV